MKLPDKSQWKKAAVIATAAIITVAIAVLGLRDGGPIQGSHGRLLFAHTEKDCTVSIVLAGKGFSAAMVELTVVSTEAECMIDRTVSGENMTGRAGVHESIKAIGEAIKK